MRTSKLLITSLLAAAAMGAVPAWAETDYSGYAGTIYTFGGWNDSSKFHDAGFVRCSVSGENSETLTYEEFGGTGTWTNQTSATFPSINSLFSDASGSTLNTLRFVASGTQITVGGTTKNVGSTGQSSQAQFDSLRLGGLIVESGASGWTLNTNNNRTFYLGAAETSFKANIGANFTIRAGSSNGVNHTIQLAGSQSWTIASGVTATLGSIVNVNEGANVVVSGGTMAVQRLTGSGILDLGSTGKLTLSNATKFNNWTGTIKVGANTGVDGTQSANWNCAGATVEFSGTKGWLYGWNGANNSVFAANINLVDNGFTWNNGSSTDTDNPIVTFTGKLTGSGSFIRDASAYNQSFVFAGNISEFTGTFTHTNSENNASLTFGGKTNATEGISAADGSVTGTSTINWYQGELTSSQDKRVYFNYSNDVRSDSTITGAILVKRGAGSLTLTGTNTYTGGTTVAAGTLIAGSTSAFGSGALTVAAGAKVSANDYAVDLGAGNVTINGAYVVTANGLLATSGTITFGDAGTLDVSGVDAGTYTIFGGTGTVSGLTQDKLYKASGRDVVVFADDNKSFTLTKGSVYDLTWTSAAGTWEASTTWQNNTQGGETDPTFADGDTVTFAASETAAKEISVVGAKDAQAVNVTGGDYAFSAGEGGLLSVRGALTVSSGASLTVNEGVLGTVSGGISLEANSTLKLVGAAIHGMTNAVSGSGKVVLDKGSVITTEPTISTANVLTGGISVEKIGNTKISIMEAQSYTGGTTITAGNIGVGHNEALGTGTITLNGGQITAHIAALTLANAIEIGANGGTIHTNDTASNTITLNGTISGTGTLTKAGTGTLYVTGNANEISGTVSVAAGVLIVGAANTNGTGAVARLSSAEAPASIVVESGAAFKTHLGGGAPQDGGAVVATSSEEFAGNFYLKDGATLGNIDGHVALTGDIVFGATDMTGSYSESSTVTLTQYWQKTVELAGVLSGAGTVKLTSPGNQDTAFYKISGDENTFSGTYKLENATNKTSTLVLSSQNAAKDAKVNLSTSGARIFLGAENVTIAGLEGVSGSTIQLTTESGAPTASTLTVNQASDTTTFEGTIKGGIALKKTGAGTLTLSGANTFTGGVTIEQGVLVAGHANALGTTAGPTTVNSGGVLKVAVDGGVTAGTVTLDGGARLAIDLTAMTVAEDTALTIISSSAISFNSISAGDMSSNDIEAYFSASDSNLGDWADYLRTWSYKAGTGLQLTLTIPEPSMFGLLAGLGALALAGTRRRRQKRA